MRRRMLTVSMALAGVLVMAAPVHVFQKDDRFVVAYGDAAAEDAVAPAQRLGDSPEFQRAAQSIDGYEVNVYLAVAPVRFGLSTR